MTQSSDAWPIRIPVFQPGQLLAFDVESIAYGMPSGVMNRPPIRLNWLYASMHFPSWPKILDAMVATVGDEEAPPRVEGERVRRYEPPCANAGQHLPGLTIELEDRVYFRDVTAARNPV